MTSPRITLPAGWLPPDMTPRDHQRAVVADDLYPPLGYLPFESVEVDTKPRAPWVR